MPALAAPRVVVYSDATSISRQLRSALQNELRQVGLGDTLEFVESADGTGTGSSSGSGSLAATSSGAGVSRSADIAVALGVASLRRLLQRPDTARQIVVVLITRAALKQELARAMVPGRLGRNLHAIVLDQPLERYLELIRLALPQRNRVAILLGREDEMPSLGERFQARGRDFEVHMARMQNESELLGQLERLLSQSDVLLALPSPLVHNRNTVQPLLLTTYRQGVPVVAYSEAYVQAGALLALYTTPAQLGRQTVEQILQLMQGRSLPALQVPQYFSVSVNATVARSLGLSLPGADVLRERLMQQLSSAD